MTNLKPWEPEQPVDTDLAKRLVEGRFPHLAPATVEPLGDGWDNTGYRVNTTLVFRFPRREVAVPLAEVETRVLPFIEGRLPLATPRLTHVGEPAEGYPWLWLGYPYMPGTVASHAGLNDDARVVMAPRLASFLRALHDLPGADNAALRLTGDTVDRFDFDARIAQFRERISEALAQQLIDSAEPFERVIDSVDRSWRPDTGTMVHGDLHSGQLLVDDEHRLVGVIDWGDTHLGDAAVDLSGVLMFLPPGGRAAFFDVYGDVDEARLHAAALRGAHVAVAVLLYAIDAGDDTLAGEARLAIRNAVTG